MPATRRRRRPPPASSTPAGAALTVVGRPGSALIVSDSWLLGLGHRMVPLPAFVLEFDVLDRNRIGVRIEIGKHLVLGNPAAEDLVGEHELARLVVELEDDVLAKVV